MKKSFSLILVLSFLIISVLILNKVISSFDKNSNLQFEYAVGEDNLIIETTLNKLNQLKINNLDDYKKINNFTFNYKYEDFIINVKVKLLESKFNINHIMSKEVMKNSFKELFYNICDKYNIDDCDYLITNFEHFFNKTIENVNLIEGRFYNQTHFNKFIDFYVKKSNDLNVKKVPWFKIFNFNSNYTSCALLTKQIKDFLNLSTNANCNEVFATYNKKFLDNLGIIRFDKKRSLIKIDIFYNYYGENNLSIIYNLQSKKVAKIEKHILY